MALADLVTTKTADQLFAELLEVLKGERLPTTSWQPGSVPRSLAKADATVLADLYATVRAIAQGYSLEGATYAWLTVHAKSRFDLDRIEATFAEVTVRLTCASGAGPYNLTPAALLVSDGTYRFRSTNTGTLSIHAGGYLDVTVRAEGAGTAYNAGDGTVTRLLSPALAGLSVNNPTLGSGEASLITAARDQETDAELRTRCLARWAVLGTGFNLDAVQYWCLSATLADGSATGITRCKVIPGPGDGTYTAVVAGSTSTVGSPAVAAALAVLQARGPVTDTPAVVAAGETPVTISGTVRLRSASYNTSANRQRATAALEAYFASLDVGEAVDSVKVGACFYAAEGVVDVDLSAPAGDTSVPGSNIATMDLQVLSGDWTS